MRIKEIRSQNRQDFRALYECEHCGHTSLGYGYDDSNFHRNVVPQMSCGKCGKTAVDHETQRGDVWKNRAEAAERWWMKAAPLIAEIARRHELGLDLNTRVRELMSWEPGE